MRKIAVLVVILLVIFVNECDGFQCCTGYNILGEKYPPQLCANYCCWNNFFKTRKECCNDESRMVSANDRDQVSCVKSWIEEHIWVPIVGSGAGLVVIIALVAYCCCGCCRR
ncbi:uncharacterized protein LOC127877719 [Dreissena polymorpha]|uniref:Uncharacterized protein n=1 Tax=Dreissena polymorpha TaxID=45954 RepID=A0A9D4KMI1_DREPO|nr:uncharacterized protein LOC127877719 [Dreissena polymorpha]KAH3842630.1 hypothetical protein DPMN_116130 [Dreissena polymorpha]